MIQIKQ